MTVHIFFLDFLTFMIVKSVLLRDLGYVDYHRNPVDPFILIIGTLGELIWFSVNQNNEGQMSIPLVLTF